MSPGRCAWSKRQRLLSAPEFAAFQPPQPTWRAARRWLAASALLRPDEVPAIPPATGAAGALRFGITVSRRQARRAVARNAVKRVLREAARQRAPVLEGALAGRRVDILFRLKAPLPGPDAAGWLQVKAQLRREAESLLGQFHDVLRGGDARLVARPAAAAAAGPEPQAPLQSLAQSAGKPAGA